jgi:hypothetical protein
MPYISNQTDEQFYFDVEQLTFSKKGQAVAI